MAVRCKMTPRHRIQPRMTKRARELRTNATVPERILWGMLRMQQLNGLKFRRQHPVGPYVADFYCPAAKLIVELDGLSHVGRRKEDDRRTEYLASRGLKVLRLTNDDVLKHPEAVTELIVKHTTQAEKGTQHPGSIPVEQKHG